MAIYDLLKKIYTICDKNKITLLLMIDVQASYLNIFHKCLLHNLCKRKIDYKVVKWVILFLTNCQIIIKINKHTTSKLSINFDLLQRLSLLSIFYLFYNVDLLEDCAIKRVKAQGFINDITLIATNKSTKSNTQRLTKVHN